MCRRKTFTLIYRVNFCNMSYFSQGLFHCFSAFRFFFNCLVTQRTMPCSCHVRTMLLPCWRRGESESCFPSGGDRGAVTHACVFTCSPPKQRHALDSRPCVELMAFTRLAGQLWLFFFFFFQTTPMSSQTFHLLFWQQFWIPVVSSDHLH